MSTLTTRLEVLMSKQQLYVWQGATCMAIYSVSTALHGSGQLEGSYCTPLGQHVLKTKIGYDAPINAVFVARTPTGEVFDTALAALHPKRDWILSRIMWLQGTQDGYNKGITPEGICCDTHRRYIYIHGTPDSEPMGIPLSHGCIRMRNSDVIELFNRVNEGDYVIILP